MRLKEGMGEIEELQYLEEFGVWVKKVSLTSHETRYCGSKEPKNGPKKSLKYDSSVIIVQ